MHAQGKLNGKKPHSQMFHNNKAYFYLNASKFRAPLKTPKYYAASTYL